MEKGKLFSYSWHIDDNETDKTVIRIYGLNEKNENVCLRVENFKPYVYLELPSVRDWDETNVIPVISKINEYMKEKRPENYKLEFKKKSYYANIDKKGVKKLFPYLWCSFPHTSYIKTLLSFCRKPVNIPGVGYVKFKVHEHNASPILQLTSLRNIPTAGWISFVGKRIKSGDPEKQTYCKYEYKAGWTHLEEFKSVEIARPLLMGYDIEVNSTDPTSMPKAKRSGDRIFQISCVLLRQGDKVENSKKYLLSLGKPEKKIVGETVDVLCFDTETELLEGFKDFIQKHQPNILIGYNIFTFDIPYMLERSETEQATTFAQQGMTIGRYGIKKSIKWSSSAYKNQCFEFLDCEGRIFVDLLPLVRRDYKMSNYKLSTIASHFLKGITKDPLDAKGIFRCYRLGMKGGKKGNKAMGIVGKYCVKDSELVVRLFETLTTWIALCEMSKVTNVPIFALYTQGQQLKVFSNAYRKCTNENIVVENEGYVAKPDDHYVGATVFPPKPGLYNKVVPFDFCLTGDTLVSLGNGLSRRMDNMGHGETVLGLGENGFDNYESMDTLVNKGVRDTVKVWFMDGTNIVATPEHKFMLEDGTWCRADELEGKYVRAGVKYTEDKICPLEKDWSLRLCIDNKLNTVRLDMNNYDEREIILAYTRILGFLSIFKKNLFSLTNIDKECLCRDLRTTVEIFSKNFEDILKTKNVYPYLSFIYDNKCPVSVKREFLAGYLGANRKVIKDITDLDIDIIKKLGFKINNLEEFMEQIGFRYNIRQTYNTELICSYKDYKKLNPDTKFSFGNYIYHMNVKNIRDDDKTIPYFRKKVIAVKKHIPTEVFDIEVNTVHNFLANSIVVSNCSLYPSSIIAYNISWDTLVADDDPIPDSMCHVMEWEDHIGCSHDPREIRKVELNNIIKGREEELKKLRYERDLKSNKDIKEEIKLKIERILKETKPYREERSNLQKSKNKHIICAKRKYRWIKSPKGILPEILSHLLDTRANTKKEMKTVKVELKGLKEGTPEYISKATYLDVLDQRQLALKISANSGYGCLGVVRGYLPLMPGAMCTTYKGRKAIEEASESIQKDWGGVLVYGDSVTGDTPILVRYPDETINIQTIDTLGKEWIDYDCFKTERKDLYMKEQSACNLEVWTHEGWKKINRVIRHKTNKKIYRVFTHTGCVDVTEDHSLLREDNSQAKPGELKIGDNLLHSFPKEFVEYDAEIVEGINEDRKKKSILTDKEAYLWGYYSLYGNMKKWELSGSKKGLNILISEILPEVEPEFKFEIKGSKLYPKKDGDLLWKKYSHILHDKNHNQVVPYIILNSEKSIRESYIEPFISSGFFTDNINGLDKLFAQGLYYIYTSLGYSVSISGSGRKFEIIIDPKDTYNKKSIQSIFHIENKDPNLYDYVYDIETEIGVFQAGIGELIVKNTDSNYVNFPHLKTAQECWDYSIKVAKEVSKKFPPPMSLAYEEKIYWTFFILTKKRYMSLACERDGVLDTKISKKGVLLQRRDNSNFVRNIYGDVVMMIFQNKTREEIISYTLDNLNKLCSGFFKPSEFVITKSVGDTGDLQIREVEDEEKKKIIYKVGDYKVKPLPENKKLREKQFKLKDCEDEKTYYLRCLPAQAQLAEKMRNRGQLVSAGSRIEYLITTTGGHTAKQYTKVESIEYFDKHSSVLSIDYLYYLKQLSNPLDQILYIMYGDGYKTFTLEQYKLRLLKSKICGIIQSYSMSKLVFGK